jgi:hypothetical protein
MKLLWKLPLERLRLEQEFDIEMDFSERFLFVVKMGVKWLGKTEWQPSVLAMLNFRIILLASFLFRYLV